MAIIYLIHNVSSSCQKTILNKIQYMHIIRVIKQSMVKMTVGSKRPVYCLVSILLTDPKYKCTQTSQTSSHRFSSFWPSLSVKLSSSHLILCIINCLYFFCCLGPPSTTTTFTSSKRTTQPVMNNCLAFVSTLNFLAGLDKFLSLQV